MPMPRDTRLESSLALLREGYEFIGNGCRRLQSPAFESRILLQRTYCLQGHEAAAMFYQSPHLTRIGAAPRMLVRSLFGAGALQGLDGAEHLARKQLFLELLSGEYADGLVATVERELLSTVAQWSGAASVDVLPQLQGVLYRAVSTWAGLPADEISPRNQHQLLALIEGAGSVGPEHLRARLARRRAEHWGATLIERQRNGPAPMPTDCPADRVARLRSADGAFLPARVAAVELINLLRPVVAVAYFLLYALVELARQPHWQAQLRENDRWLLPFVQEVRRLYAFFPFVAARVAQDFVWQDMSFRRGARVLLDLYGSNRHGDAWEDPDTFRPERFESLQLDAFHLITQGGGEHRRGHRCAGEWVTIDLMQACLRILSRRVRYQAPVISGRPARNRFPMRFAQRFVIHRVEPTAR